MVKNKIEVKTTGADEDVPSWANLPACREIIIPIDDIVLPKTLKRKMSPEKIQMLTGSMKLIGLHHAITVTSDMVLVAGNHRLAAARALGWKEIKAEIIPADDILNELVTIDENLLRHNLTVLEEGEHLKRRDQLLTALGERAKRGDNQHVTNGDQLVEIENGGEQTFTTTKKKPSQKVTTKNIAHEMGMGERDVQYRMQIATGIDGEVRELIRGMDIADNKAELLRLIKLTPSEQRSVITKIKGGMIKTVKEGTALTTREKQRDEFNALAEEAKKLPDTMVLVNDDFFEYESSITDDSVDLVLTDVPYVDEWKENIAPCMSVFNRILKPGGVMIMVVGHVRLPEVFEGFAQCKSDFKDEALEFYHECALAHKGHLAAMHHVGAMNGFKPIIIGMKSPIHKPYKMYNDLVEGSGREKTEHEWQQSVEEILPLVDAFSKPGDVVCDPFMGTGTYGIASKLTVRKFIGIEKNTTTFEDARRRIVQAVV
jgi:SAM-dependent methyltransferase